MSAPERLLSDPPPVTKADLTPAGRWLILVTAFLGWFFGGTMMTTTQVGMYSAAVDLLAQDGSLDRERFTALNKVWQDRNSRPFLPAEDKKQIEAWRAVVQGSWAYLQCSFLFGAAAGGFLLGRLGDRIGRSSAMAVSILCLSLGAAATYFARTLGQLQVVWFVACLGVGGMWPNGVALLSETWSSLSRPMVAGIMGTSANVGIFALSTVASRVEVTPDQWRWMTFVCASAAPLGLFALAFVPESPRWLAARAKGAEAGLPAGSGVQVFRPPLLGITLVGIMLATVPLIGGWGSANWMTPWAAEAGAAADPPQKYLQAHVVQARSVTGIVGSLLGGWIGHVVGRRLAYCLVSLAALFCAQYTFWCLSPTDASFLFWVAALGFFSGVYFGWMPLFLPELFPTQARSTGAGVSFNFGRILTATTVFASGALTAYFRSDFPLIGRITSLCFLIGAVAIWFAPDTTKRQLED